MTTDFGNLMLDNFETGGWRVIVAKGELSVYEAPQLRERLVEAAKEGNKVVVDLQEVDFIDSTGLGVMVAALKRLRATGGDLRVVCATHRILTVFEVTGLSNVIEIFETVKSATALVS